MQDYRHIISVTYWRQAQHTAHIVQDGTLLQLYWSHAVWAVDNKLALFTRVFTHQSKQYGYFSNLNITPEAITFYPKIFNMFNRS